MASENVDQQTNENGSIQRYIESFLIDRKIRGVGAGTLGFYKDELGHFVKYLADVKIIEVEKITSDLIRRYLLDLATHRNAGGVHAAFRPVRTFLNWYDTEYEPEGWTNPIRKIKPPKVSSQAMPGISIEDIKKMVEVATGDRAKRDQLVLLFLLDTGARAAEFLALNVGDVDLITGAVIIQHGKGDKWRKVFIGRTVLKQLRAYLKGRANPDAKKPLFVTDENERLKYGGLKMIVYRLADKAGVARPGLHDFRRAFALQCLRNKMDLITLSRLLGHSNVSITQRYVAQTDEDLAIGHRQSSPVDNNL